MTKKRYILDDAGELIDLNNHQFVNYGDEVCNLLNELNDENKELKKKLESKQRLINAYDNHIKTLKEDGVLDD